MLVKRCSMEVLTTLIQKLVYLIEVRAFICSMGPSSLDFFKGETIVFAKRPLVIFVLRICGNAVLKTTQILIMDLNKGLIVPNLVLFIYPQLDENKHEKITL